jgi:hypothetical protein
LDHSLPCGRLAAHMVAIPSRGSPTSPLWRAGSRLKPLGIDHSLDRCGGKLSASRLHIPLSQFLVIKVLDHAPAIRTEEVHHTFGI